MRIIQAVPRVARKPHSPALGNKGPISNRTLHDAARSRPIAILPSRARPGTEAPIAAREDLDHLILATPDLIEAGYSDDTPARNVRLVDLYDQPNDRPEGQSPQFEFALRFGAWADSLRTVPSLGDVMLRYDVSRATANRWRAAYRAARGLA